MARAENMKQAVRKDCPNVCQTKGEMDIPAWMTKPDGFNVKFLYKALEQPAFPKIVFDKGQIAPDGAMASNNADARRLWRYKSDTSPNRA